MKAPLDHLRDILELLGPGLSLQVDQVAFPMFFGGEIGQEPAEVKATKFARDNGCSFVSDGRVAIFGRAYAK